MEDDVDDQPVVEEGAVRDRNAGEVADGAVGPVATHHVAGSHGLTTVEVHHDVLVAVDEIDHRRAPLHRDLGELVDAVEQDRFEIGLGEHRRLRPARYAVADPAETDERATLGVLEFVDLRWLDDL